AMDDSGSALLYAGPDASTRVIGRAGSVSGVAVSADGSTAVFTDRAANAIVRIDDLNGAASFTTIAGPDGGVVDPLGVALTRSGKTAIVAMPSGVIAVDLAAGGSATRFDCACEITSVEVLAGDVLHLGGGVRVPLWLFDADQGKPRFVFV